MKVLLWMPTADGKIPVDMVQFLIWMRSVHDIDMVFPVRQPIAMARNKIINHAIDNNYDYVRFLDDDNPPEVPNALDLLLEHNAPVVSWCVPSRLRHKDGNYKLCIYDKKEYVDWTMWRQMEHVPEWFTEIENCWAGCVVFQVEALRHLVQHFPAPCETALHKYYQIDDERVNGDYIEDPKEALRVHSTISEDLILVERLKYLWYKAYADPRVCCKHQASPYITVRDLPSKQ